MLQGVSSEERGDGLPDEYLTLKQIIDQWDFSEESLIYEIIPPKYEHSEESSNKDDSLLPPKSAIDQLEQRAFPFAQQS